MRRFRHALVGFLALAFLVAGMHAGLAAAAAAAPADAPAKAAAVLNVQGLWWNAPAGSESGWGINFAHQGGIVFATWFTYDAARKPWWLIAQLDKSAEGVYSGPVWTVTGPPFNAVPFPPGGSPGGSIETPVGTMTATFADATHGTLLYTVNGVTQTKTIVPQVFGTLPACAWGQEPDLALATNYQDLWWNPQESGWGINFTHQGDIIFATWFTYDAARQPWWLIALLDKKASGVYAGPVSTVSGPPFNAVPFPPGGSPGGAVETEVGTATVTFAHGNSATFAYTVNGTTQTKSLARQVFAPPGTVCTPLDASKAFVDQFVDLSGRANRGEITSEQYVAQLTALVASVDTAARGVELLQRYLETAVLGRNIAFPASAQSSAQDKALSAVDLDPILASPTFQLLEAALRTNVFLQAPDAAGNQIAAANVAVDIALAGLVVRVSVLDAAANALVPPATGAQLLALVATNPFTAAKQLYQALGLPIPPWLVAAPACLTGCGPLTTAYSGPVSGQAVLTVSAGPLSCTANVGFSGTVGFNLTVDGVAITSGTGTVAGDATVTNSNNPVLCPNGVYPINGSAPVTGTVSNMTANLLLGGRYPGTLTASLSGNTITGTISTVLVPTSPPVVANFTLTRL